MVYFKKRTRFESMSQHHPTFDNKPREQSSKTPSGKRIPMAMSMMVDSMVRMIQKAYSLQLSLDNRNLQEDIYGN